MKSGSKRLVVFFLLVTVGTVLTGCGGGGGNPAPPDDFFLNVSTPYADGQIFYQNSITVSGQTSSEAAVTVNGLSADIDDNGYFSKSGVQITSNTTSITVVATRGSFSYSVTRKVYYDNKVNCQLVFVALDYQTGRNRVYTADRLIPGSARLIYDEDPPGWTHSSPAVRPGKTTVVFVREDTAGNQNIVEAACTGSGSPVELTDTTGIHYRGISWSHGGGGIAYSSDAAGQYDIYAVSLAGGDPTQITDHAASDDSPAWLPGDTGLVFSSLRAADGGAGTGAQSNLWKVSFNDLQDVEPLYDPAGAGAPDCVAGEGNCSAKNPDVSSGGKVIFQFEDSCPAPSTRQAPPDSTCSNLYVMSSITAAPSPVTTGANHFLTPHWENVLGMFFVFVAAAEGEGKIMLIGFVGTFPTLPTDTGLIGSQPDY